MKNKFTLTSQQVAELLAALSAEFGDAFDTTSVISRTRNHHAPLLVEAFAAVVPNCREQRQRQQGGECLRWSKQDALRRVLTELTKQRHLTVDRQGWMYVRRSDDDLLTGSGVTRAATKERTRT